MSVSQGGRMLLNVIGSIKKKTGDELRIVAYRIRFRVLLEQDVHNILCCLQSAGLSTQIRVLDPGLNVFSGLQHQSSELKHLLPDFRVALTAEQPKGGYHESRRSERTQAYLLIQVFLIAACHSGWSECSL